MSLEAAGLLLDFAGVLDDGSTAVRLAGAVDQIESYDPDARGAIELARVVAAGHFAAVSHDRAVDLVDVLAVVLGLEVHAGRHARLAESLDALPELLVELDARLTALPAPVKSTLRRRIAKRISAVIGRGDPASIPAGELVRFAEALEREELKLARSTPPVPVRDEGEAA